MADRKKNKKSAPSGGISGGLKEIFMEASGNVPIIEIRGTSSVLISGCLGITDFSEKHIRFRTSEGSFCISGDGLIMRGFENDCVEIRGRVSGVVIDGIQGE